MCKRETYLSKSTKCSCGWQCDSCGGECCEQLEGRPIWEREDKENAEVTGTPVEVMKKEPKVAIKLIERDVTRKTGRQLTIFDKL